MSPQVFLVLMFLGLIFGVSALAKLHRPTAIRPMFEKLGLGHTGMQWAFLGLIFIETWISISFLWFFQAWSLGVAFVLLLLMIACLYRLIKSGYHEKCGCYGQWMMLSPQEAMKLDLVYLGMLLWIAYEAELFSSPLKSFPIVPLFIALGAMGIGKLRFKNMLEND